MRRVRATRHNGALFLSGSLGPESKNQAQTDDPTRRCESPRRAYPYRRERGGMNKKDLNETEICQNFITPAILRAGWDQHTQVRREFAFTAGRVILRGKIAVRGKRKRGHSAGGWWLDEVLHPWEPLVWQEEAERLDRGDRLSVLSRAGL